ncbi:unnamed protein product [Prunus brigantina]
MGRMGFDLFWIKMIMTCITTVSFFVILNGQPGRTFYPSRALSFIRDRIKKKLGGWKANTLSLAGNETLLKAVATTIPTYSMMCFCYPANLCKEINGDILKIHWKSWQSLCRGKDNGGLRFRDLMEFNLALLGKQCWRMLSNPNAYWVRVLKAKYFLNEELMQAKVGARA